MACRRRVVVMLAVLVVLCAAECAYTQTTWTLIRKEEGKGVLNLYNHATPSIVEKDPIQGGELVDQILLPWLGKTQPHDGGVAVDKFHNWMVATTGNRNDLSFILMPIKNSDCSSRRVQIVDQFVGNYPFQGNITGIDILYGENGRPRELICAAFSEYGSLNMRTTPWQWSQDTWPIPNSGRGSVDIAIGTAEIDDGQGGRWPRYTVLYSVERTGIVVGTELYSRSTEAIISTSCGVVQASGITVDTARPTSIYYRDSGRRNQWGTVIVLGMRSDGVEVTDCPLGRSNGPPSVRYKLMGLQEPEHFALGLAFSSEITNLAPFIGEGTTRETLGMRIRVQNKTQPSTPAQTIMPVREGTRYMYRFETCGPIDSQRDYQAFLTLTNNPNRITEGGYQFQRNQLIDPSKLRFKGTYDLLKDAFVADINPSELPSSPVPIDKRFYYFAQWVLVPPLDNNAVRDLSGFVYASNPFRLAFSNTQ